MMALDNSGNFFLDEAVATVVQTSAMIRYKCLRCNHQWYPRGPKRPRACGKCKSFYWDVRKKSKQEPR